MWILDLTDMTFDLFAPQPQANVLPFDGVVEDYGLILDQEQSQQYLQHFLSQLACDMVLAK